MKIHSLQMESYIFTRVVPEQFLLFHSHGDDIEISEGGIGATSTFGVVKPELQRTISSNIYGRGFQTGLSVHFRRVEFWWRVGSLDFERIIFIYHRIDFIKKKFRSSTILFRSALLIFGDGFRFILLWMSDTTGNKDGSGFEFWRWIWFRFRNIEHAERVRFGLGTLKRRISNEKTERNIFRSANPVVCLLGKKKQLTRSLPASVSDCYYRLQVLSSVELWMRNWVLEDLLDRVPLECGNGALG